MAEKDRVSSPTQSAEAQVQELYDFRDHYVERNGLEKAGDKEKEVQEKMKECLLTVESFQGDIKNKAIFQLLRGKTLNITSKHSQEAEEALSKAVKLDPKLVEAWNHLGECYWKKDDVSAAKNCFTGALNHLKNKVSLRNLSMVLRQLSGPPVEKMKLIEESVERAKEAVQMDIKDGTSWLILGNAYLCEFFYAGQVPVYLNQCMQAYGQAEKDPVARGNPDLHFNRSTAYKYQENYQQALEGFNTAAQLDPSWTEARTQETDLFTYLRNVQDMIELKGKLKSKKIDTFVKSLSERDLGVYSTNQVTNKNGKSVSYLHVPVSDLHVKVNEGKVVLGKVVCTVHLNDLVPFTLCMIDENQTCVAVMVYNLAQGAGMKIGDSIAIPDPCFKKVKLTHKGKEISFTSIHVDVPCSLVVNGRTLDANKEARVILSVSTMSE